MLRQIRPDTRASKPYQNKAGENWIKLAKLSFIGCSALATIKAMIPTIVATMKAPTIKITKSRRQNTMMLSNVRKKLRAPFLTFGERR